MVSRKKEKAQVEELHAESTLHTSERHKRDDQLDVRPPMEKFERVNGRELKKVIPLPQNTSNNNIPSKEEPIKFKYIVRCFSNILKEEKTPKTIISIQRIEKSKKLSNLKKFIGARFVKYLERQTGKELPTGDDLDSLDEWNSLFGILTRDETSEKEPLKLNFINKLKFDISAIKTECISLFIEFVSNLNPKEIHKSNFIAEGNKRAYEESCITLTIVGKVIGQILKKIKYEITYFKIETWNENWVVFEVIIGTGDQKEICDKIKDCIDLNTTYSYNSNEPQIMPFKHKCEDEAEELEKEETKKEEGTGNVLLTTANNLSSDKDIAEKPDSTPNKASELVPGQTNERLEKEPSNLFKDQTVESDCRSPKQQLDWNEGLDPERTDSEISKIYENSDFYKNSKYQTNNNQIFINNSYAQYG